MALPEHVLASKDEDASASVTLDGKRLGVLERLEEQRQDMSVTFLRLTRSRIVRVMRYVSTSVDEGRYSLRGWSAGDRSSWTGFSSYRTRTSYVSLR